MHDPGPLGLLSARGVVRDEPVHQRPGRMARRRMGDDACRLVDDEEMLVLVRDAQVHRLADDICGRGGRRLELDLLAAGEPVALRLRSSVDADVPRGEEPLGGRTRADLGQSGEKAVEPLARRGVRNA